MAFIDFNINPRQLHKDVTGLEVTQPSPLTLDVSAGSVTEFQTGDTFNSGAETHTFTSDPTYKVRFFMGIVTNGTSTDLWVDAYPENGKLGQGKPPSGYWLLAELAWGVLEAGATDFGDVHRRVYL